MAPDEETKRMLPAAQPVPMVDLEINETSSALRSSQDDPPPPYQENTPKPTISSVYGKANSYTSLRCVLAVPILVSAAWILAQGTKPTTSWIALPWAAYCLVCSTIHLLLFAHRAIRPRGNRHSHNSKIHMLPGRKYVAVLIGSPILLLVALAGGAAVLHYTSAHFGERDKSNGMTARCGKSRKRCYPKTLEGLVYDFCCAGVAFAGGALVSALLQCYEMFRLSRNEYTEEEVREAADSISKRSCGSIINGW
ncbi:hypothetical protein F5144DRAFT_585012 [Chaetomium tenue]|uniref:Uncharacterized protein n=1 Tax=Chaetomium tenue TaxID=1854479 RepID=A0ACB7NUV2_9PEZI|nr:hypothetical protein F5144DRAFT_585012 [Chaetomium globosum]